MKGMQLGSVLGFVSIPIYAFVRKQPIGQSSRSIFPLTLVGGVSIAYGKLYKAYLDGKLDNDGVDDRAYRIMHNMNQRKVDRYCAIGATVGAVAGMAMARGRPGITLSSACLGIVCGVASFVGEKLFLEQKASESSTESISK